MKRLLWIVLALIVMCGPLRAGQSNPSGTGVMLDDDEKRLWLRAAEEEKRIDTSGFLYRNAEMEGYMETIVRKLVAPEQLTAVPIRISVIRDASFNAFTLPNGRIYVHSGLLASMENEAQFATLIGHESVHALHHHAVKELRDAREKFTFSAILGALTGNVLLPFGQLGALASISGYSRENETEADREGFLMLVRAGYEPKEAPKLFMILRKESLAEKRNEPYFFASHPKLQERIDNYENLLKGERDEKKGGIVNTDVFIRTISPLILDSVKMDVKAGRYEQARDTLDRYLVVMKGNAIAFFLMGETFRLDGKTESTAKATEYYQLSVKADPLYPEPHRILGILAYKKNDREQARISLERYLRLSPKALDRGHIEQMLKTLH